MTGAPPLTATKPGPKARRIHRIAAPALILWGGADGIVAPLYAQEFAKRIAGAKVEIIGNAGHLPHIEQEEQAATAIGKFLG